MQNKIKSAIFRRLIKDPRLYIIMLLPLTFIIRLCAENIQGVADAYSFTVYRFISRLFNNINSVLPFSLGELFVVLFLAAAIFFLFYGIAAFIKRRGKRLKTLLNYFINILCVVSTGLFLFMTNCGINYYRSDFSELSRFEVKEVSSEKLKEVCIYLADSAAKERQLVKENEENVFTSDEQLFGRCAEAVNSLDESYSFIGSGYKAPKGVVLSELMSECMIEGIYFPYTFEANVNTHITALELPFVACHESSHIHGFMSEEDANFIAFLACKESKYHDLRYSGYMMSLIYATNALYSADREGFGEVYNHYTEGMKRDIEYYNKYWDKYITPVSEAAATLNDSYLKSNSKSEGIKSYGKMVDLVIAYYEANGK